MKHGPSRPTSPAAQWSDEILQMIDNNTVFVSGAGASWHYGYPTGNGLVDDVIAMAARLSEYCRRRLETHQLVQFVPAFVAEHI
jgi:hypothetical protein